MLILAWALRGADWRSGPELHTSMEVTAIVLAVIIGALALVRYNAQREYHVLLIGAGFLGAACLDGFHAIVTSNYHTQFATAGESFASSTGWILSRLFLATMLLLSFLVNRFQRGRGAQTALRPAMVYLYTGAIVLLCILFSAGLNPPRSYYPELPFPRPYEFAPAILFAVALAGYASNGNWRRDPVDNWLLVSLILGLTAQSLFMPFSGQLFDAPFDTAHALKVASYTAALIGFIASTHYDLVATRNLNAKLTAEIGASERKQRALLLLQSELHDSEEKVRTVLQTIDDCVLTVDTNDRILSVNASAVRKFGHTAEAVSGLPIRELIPALPQLRDLTRTADSATPGGSAEYIARHSDGTKFDIALGVNRTKLNGQVMYVCVIRDITDRKRHERQLQQYADELAKSNQELEQFASIASHDLQEPLRKISAFSDRLSSKHGAQLDEQGRDYLTRMQNSAARMQVLISDLLAFSRISTSDRRFVQTDFNAVLQDVLADLELRIGETGAKIAAGNLPTLHADPRQIHQLFQNLISNSLKYHKEGVTPAIDIRATFDYHQINAFAGKSHRICNIEFRDNGIGFEQQHAERIFEIFQRLHGRNAFEGTGIGLAICRKIVERHGGSIAAAADGNGTVFTVSLPVSVALEEAVSC